MARFDSFLRLVAEQGASDLHFDAGSKPIIRHDGDLVELPFRKLTRGEAKRFVREILTEEEKTKLDDGHELDFVYAIPDVGRFRCNVFNHSRGVGAVFRIISNKVPRIEDLRLPDSVHKLIRSQNGLILVCGPTGSGKTSTLAALVNELNERDDMHKHIISVEDPVEYIFESKHSVITQRQVGLHCEDFPSALRSALRESPDVIVIGEMRDLETISLALNAAETGALVLGTLHTNSAPKAIDRMIDAFPEESREQMRSVISVMLKGVIAQHLVKRSSGEGRIAIVEVLIGNFAIANMIRENKTHLIQAALSGPDGRRSGMQSLDSCILRYVKEGLIGKEDGLHIAHDPETLRQLIADLPEEE